MSMLQKTLLAVALTGGIATARSVF